MFSTARATLSSHFCRAKPAPSSVLVAAAASGFRTTLLSSSQTRFQSTQQQRVVRDASYPFPLYYHLVPSDSVLPSSASQPSSPPPSSASSSSSSSSDSNRHSNYALSFLPTFPKHNRQIVGYLSHHHPDASSSELKVLPNKFTENEAFNTVLHTVIQANLHKDAMVQMVLQQQLEGWAHIADYRNPAPHGRIPLPEDIFGSVQIVDGVIQPSTYQRMPSHRIASIHGLFQLSEYLHERLVHHLESL